MLGTRRCVNLKLMRLVAGSSLILYGVVGVASQGIAYTTREPVVVIGLLEATTETKKTIPLPPALGALALAGGIALVIVGAKRS